ncbi:hypothetical protein BGX20_001112 [Mortierella sp. AD010]|nr:hypothetical protein BGX20_001112 [Mortierella sp. AD010]
MSSSNQVISNATTMWTVGQQKSNTNSQSVPSDAVPSSSSSSTARTNTNTHIAAPTITSKVGGAEEKPLEGVNAHSSRSKFLRAFGKFKNKHLSQKKANAATTGALSATCNNSITSDRTSSTTKSFVLPPIQFDREDSLGHTDSASMRSYTEPITPKENIEQLHDIDMEDSEASRSSYPNQDRPASSSLRIKLKNRVNTTLASFKSSSSLREKAKAQAASTSSSNSQSPVSPVSPQQPPSPDTTTTDPQQNNTMIRLTKPLWAFSRIRPESSVHSKPMPWPSSANSDRPSSMVETSPQTKTIQNADLDAIMISPELGPSTQQASVVEEVDSDEGSIDFIMRSDYDDYTQDAELPIKKRNKRAQAMKRFLLPQKATAEKDKGKSIENSQNTVETNHVIPQRNSKKRPKDQDSIEQRQGMEPNKMAKSNSEEPPEWRKAIMKSLHIGKGNQALRKTKGSPTSLQPSLESPVSATSAYTDILSPPESPEASQRDSGVYPSDQGSRSKRPESISSARSRSMATASHPGLLATTLPKPTNPITRRETLEMAMRRRRRSSAARSNLLDTETYLTVPRIPNQFDDDAASVHVTHTFTSFTLELADMQHANAVVNNSEIPGLFNFKRQPRLTMSSMNQMDTEAEFKGFDSDGDAMSGYTGDADVSMEEIFVRPKTPQASRSGEGKEKGKSRESGSFDHSSRRKMSIGDADSDTLPELPTLPIRRDMNRSSTSSRISNNSTRAQENAGRESPRSQRRTGSSSSPGLSRKASRAHLAGSLSIDTSSAASARNPPTQTSVDEVSSWKPRNTLNTKTALTAKTNGLSSSAHQRQPSSVLQQFQSQHQQQTSADTLLPNHLKNFSNASTLSASSGYSAQTLNGNVPLVFQPKEFNQNHDAEPTTPVDLKSMDFDTLLKTAEREQQKGQEERTLKKKKSFQFQNSRALKAQHHGLSNDRSNIENYSSGFYRSSNTSSSTKSALSALVASAPNLDELRTRNPDTNHDGYSSQQHSPPNSGRSHSSNGSKFGGLQVQTNRPLGPSHPRVPVSKSAITFDLAESQAISNSGIRNNPRSKRVMKKKTSVIKLSGNVQGRREDDGMIRVTVTPTVDLRQWRS